ncbi:MAG: rRNA pseudouridine synthase [Oscillospiraceae bacterium]|jgi:16S rRNA pseudouridine516 synthase|nr:rRNA pseudouridine synthase [Oscillospiraceae bacterium]
MPLHRLDQLLVSRGIGSRKDVSRLIRAGFVRVNGVAVRETARKIDTSVDTITANEQSVLLDTHIVIMLHKPAGVISASRDPKAATVLDLLPAHLRRRGLFPVGRLDKDTTGLLIITDDGDLAHALLSPKKHVPKTYIATLQTPATPEDARAFAAGVTMAADGHYPQERCEPAELQILPDQQAQVVLREGKYHQIKRMFAARGNQVIALHRIAMGGLHLDMRLLAGDCRLLTEKEIKKLKQS